MYTSYIGKKFLQLYREKEKKSEDYSAQQFFDDVLFPLFFDDEKHLMHVGNSPFFQKPKEEDIAFAGSKSSAQLANLRRKIEEGIPSGAIYVGFGAEDAEATSSGQLTSINFNTSPEDMYSSWIGQALSFGVSGGFVMLINEADVLWSLFKGWGFYRKYIKQTPNLKDKQIETWNGHWLSHSFSDNFDILNPTNNLSLEVVEMEGRTAIPTQSWSKVVFALSKKYANSIITAYAYNLSQTNTTLGFINLYLPEVRRFYELRDKIFLDKQEINLKDKDIEKLETFFNFKTACKFGTIGLKALEPKGLREFMPKGSDIFTSGKDYKFSDNNSYINFLIYKIWIIAMLKNKTELLELAANVAQALIVLEQSQSQRDKTKTTQDRSSKELLEAKNVRSFVEGLTDIIRAENSEIFKNVVEQILKMPSDNFPLFATLIRFEYAYQKLKSNS